MERIGAHAFEACQRLERLELSTGLRQIDQKAFAGCKSLSFLSLPDGLQSVGESILSGCDGLVELVLPFVGNRKIDCEDLPQYPFGYLFGQKRNNNAKTEQFYHADSLSATRSEFYSIPPRLRSVTVKGGYLPDGAFANCAGLTEITLGEGIKRIGKWAFSCCEHLRAVHLPTTVKRIGEGAFYRCRKLTEVALPTAVKEVSPSLFTHCVSLRSLRLPKGIEAIGRYALLDCKKLTELGYGGRAEDWKKIEIEPDCGFDKRLTVRGADGTVFRP